VQGLEQFLELLVVNIKLGRLEMPGVMDSLTTLFQNPDFLQMLAGTGTGLGKGQELGEALGGATTGVLKNVAGRNAYQGLIEALMGGGVGPEPTVPVTPAVPAGVSMGRNPGPALPNSGQEVWNNYIQSIVTPKGTPGADSLNITADGMTAKFPSPAFLSKTSNYGGSVPAEAVPATPTASVKSAGGQDFSGFFQALLG